MGRITFILGGVRSGKSSYALALAKKGKKKTAFIATCQALDQEMSERIKLHRRARPGDWRTFEEAYDVSGLLHRIGAKFEIILIDCVTILISNLMLRGLSEDAIRKEVNDILAALNKKKAKVIIVSNEVGLGIVPRNKLARDFRDLAGQVNQIIAKKADAVFFMAAGLPLKVK